MSTLNINIQGNDSRRWVPTGFQLFAGEAIEIRATNAQISRHGHKYGNGPDGLRNMSTNSNFLARDLTAYALIGRVGTSGTPFKIGRSLDYAATTAGELYLAYNDENYADNTGEFQVTVTSPVLRYGDIYHIMNGTGNWQAGYIDVCGTAGDGVIMRSTACGPNPNRGENSGSFQIMSALGIADGTVVNDGEDIYLKNMMAPGSYLDISGTVNCGGAGTEGVISNATAGTSGSAWKVVADQDGPVSVNQTLHLQSVSTSKWLQICGHNSCSGNIYDVNASPSKNREDEVSHWRFVTT